MPAAVAAIYRYPVKGLSPERLPRLALRRGQPLPADRRYAIENGSSGFDPAHPAWKAKTYYLMLMRNARLAALRTHYDDDSHMLTIHAEGKEVARGDLASPAGRHTIEDYFAREFANELRGPPKVLQAEGYSFSDVAKKVVSLINLESVAAISDMLGGGVIDPLRFRGNLHVSSWPAWHEFDLLGQTLAIGAARLKVVKRIMRCAAVNVDPTTAMRDMDIPKTLMKHLDHMDCGVYAEVVGDGEVKDGDAITVEAPKMA